MEAGKWDRIWFADHYIPPGADLEGEAETAFEGLAAISFVGGMTKKLRLGNLVLGKAYDAGTFLDVESYVNLRRWAEEIGQRPAVRRGRIVNKTSGHPSQQLHERHDASDFDLRTQDKLSPAAE